MNIDVAALRSGQRRTLARAITLIESTAHRAQAEALLAQLGPAPESSLRIGLSGPPGVGKSTLIEALGLHAIDQGHKVAVLAIDPSSVQSGGAILGDKTRMPLLSTHPRAFIRPSPAGDTLGGVARRSFEALRLCEAAGYDLIIVETVGVGQSEIAVSQMSDIFVLLVQAASGDDLQGIKRGIMELADLLVINKADGELQHSAQRSLADCKAALPFLPARREYWHTRACAVSALERQGLDTLWQHLMDLRRVLGDSGRLTHERAEQSIAWMQREATELLHVALREHHSALQMQLEHEVREQRITPAEAGRKLADAVLMPV